ncbi:MAG TPA: hypothetical protein VKH65_02155 [Myxococcales bacterium]|nr:hypothetical protein [Myxococcales bacterium]
MMNPQGVLSSLSDSDLLARTRELVADSCRTEADLLLHLGEIDERKLYLERSFASMFAFCLGELRFSEGATYNRILVAGAARQIPAIIDAMRFGKVHLAGLRLLAPHLTAKIIARCSHRRRASRSARSRSWSPDCHRNRPLRHRCGNFLRVPKLPRRSLWL